MSKFSGMVGYVSGQTEVSTDVWEETYEEHLMRGDVVRNSKQQIQGDTRYDDVQLSNELSLVGGAFAYKNFSNIRYVWYLGQKWKVTNVEVARPRINVTLGGVWPEKSS